MLTLDPASELAVLARALYRSGYSDEDDGHITYRHPDGAFLALPWEMGWDEVRASDIVVIDERGDQIDGRWTPPPAIRLHLEYHSMHPRADVTIHQHPQYATVFSALGRIPPAYDQRSAFLADEDIALYDDYAGPVDDASAARQAVAAFGKASCTLLQNHGVFVVGDTVAQAYGRAVALERRCRQAWHVEAVGGGTVMPLPDQQDLRRFLSPSGGVAPFNWSWAIRREVRLGPDVLN